MAENVDRPGAPQRGVGVPDRLWRQAATIAKQRQERDLIGHGVAVVIRNALRSYVRRHRDLLPPDLRD